MKCWPLIQAYQAGICKFVPTCLASTAIQRLNVAEHISIRDISFFPFEEFVFITVTTDVPCHLFCRLSLKEPWIHKKPSLRRGVQFAEDVRFCFTVYEDNEQTEAGDTITHTWAKPSWPPCTTKWCYFWGYIGGEVSISTSPFFKYHRPLPPEFEELIILAEYASRSLYCSSATWAATWNGVSEKILNTRQSPGYYLETRAEGAAPYDLFRTFMSFYLPEIPAGSTILEASLSLWALTHSALSGVLCITEGQCQEPVMEDDWPLCNPYDTILGQIPMPDLVNNQYNVIPVNQAGLDWLKIAMSRSRQKESFDFTANAYFLCRDIIQLCQTFTPDQNHLLQGVKLRLKKKAGVPKIYYVDIYAVDANHHPTGLVLASGELDGKTFSTATWGDYEAFLLGAGCQVYKGIEYGIVLRSPLSNATNYAEWIVTTVGGYPAGVVVYSLDGGGTWQDDYLAYDLIFVEYNHLLPKPRQLTLRTINDVQNVATPPLGNYYATYHAAQKGVDYAPFLTIKYKPPI